MWDSTLKDPQDPDNHVRVTFKTNLTDKATSAHAEFKPHLPPTAPGRQQQTDPVGLTFMLAYPSIDDEPAVEVWSGEGTEDGADGSWNREKVQKDILDLAAAEGYSAAQVAEWKALFDFNKEHPNSDDCPPLPVELALGLEDGSSLKLEGMPIPWSQLWSKLAGRFPRPHHSSDAVFAPAEATASGAGSVARTTASPPEIPLALRNSVTGLNYPEAPRRNAAALVARRTRVADMEAFATKSLIAMGELHFILLERFEGEFRIGIGRPIALAAAEEGVDAAFGKRVIVEWLARKNWTNNPAKAELAWAESPSFMAARHGTRGRGAQILPVPVELTGMAEYFPDLPLADGKQKLRLRKRCVDLLREFCKSKRPDLLRSRESSQQEERAEAEVDGAAFAPAAASAPAPSAPTARAERASATVRAAGDNKEADEADKTSSDEDEQVEEEVEEAAEEEQQLQQAAHICGRQRKRIITDSSDEEVAPSPQSRAAGRPKRTRVSVTRFA